MNAIQDLWDIQGHSLERFLSLPLSSSFKMQIAVLTHV